MESAGYLKAWYEKYDFISRGEFMKKIIIFIALEVATVLLKKIR